jgi:hypothetical protein
VSAQHHRSAGRHIGNIIDEDHPEGLEVVDHEPVVHYLVVAKDRRFEDASHPVQGLYGLFDTRAEAARSCEDYFVNTHLKEPSKSFQD